MRTKFPATVMLFTVVSREGHIITPPFFPQGLRANADADAYVVILQTTVVKVPRIDRVGKGKSPSIMSSNKIRLHPIKLSKPRIGWMAENFHHYVTPNLWPPNSSDRNPLN
ncbi:hypothetical protein ACTXT7_001487 [Hymenolepis weldensis]